jgi:vitamin B12 transporter
MASTGAVAQDVGTTVLEGITVYSANRTPTEASKVGSSVSVITEKDIQAQSKTFVKDYLEQLPGVNFTQTGAPGSTTSISVRGANGSYVKVLVDGMDISDPSATTTQTAFEHLLVGDVSRIELLKGSQSTLYGGDAVAGVISIETKAATKPGFSHSGGAEGGQYNTFSGAYTAGYAATDGSNISFTVQGIDTDGFSSVRVGTEDDGYENLTFSARGEYVLSPSMKVFFAARTLDARNEFDDSFTPADNDDYTDTVQHAGRIGTEFSLLDGAFQNTFAFQGMKIERDIYGSNANWFEGDRLKGEYKGVFRFNEHLSLLGGADWEETGAENAGLSSRKSADVSGVYAQLMMEPIDGLVLTGGGRIDDHSAFGQFDTYRLTAAYLVPGTETKFRASRGTGFRAPSLDELYGEYSFVANYGNPNLQPEESESWDAGVEQGLLNGRIRLGATYFELDTDNLILFNFDCFSLPVGCLVNVPGVTQRSGVELTAVALVTDGLALSGSYTYVDTETEDGSRLPRVPKHDFVFAVDMAPMDKVEINVTAKYIKDSIDSNGLALDDYFLLSAKAAYEFAPGWKAYVRGENLLDEEYETVTYFATPGLSVYGGITMNLPSD